MRPVPSTRERLIQAASPLFADQGYRGASVRTICDVAGTNPAAVSYHFGGKRQLYRACLRLSAERLAAGDGSGQGEASVAVVVRQLLRRLLHEPAAGRLLLRDLADGGSVAVEALSPTLRRARAALRAASGQDDTPEGEAEGRRLFVELAGTLLAAAAWPAVGSVLEMDARDGEELLGELLEAALERAARSRSASGALAHHTP